MKSKITATALILLLPLLLTACTLQDLPLIGKYLGNIKIPFLGGNKAPSGPVTLTVWGLWESPEVMNKLIEKYKETHPTVTINYDDRSILKLEDYKATVYTRANQEDAPDIVFVHNSWVKGLKDSLAAAPANVINTETYSQRFYPVATNNAVIDNNVYALPLYYDGLVLVYNKTHFEQIDQREPPTAWEEFRKLALALTIRGSENSLVRAGAAIGTANNIDFFSDILGLMLSQAQVELPDGLDSKPAQDATTFYTNFAREDKVWNDDMPEAANAFAREKVSMIFVPAWSLVSIIQANPQLSIGVAPVPQALPSEPVSWGTFWMTAVTGGSKNKDAAWDFIKFLSDNDQQQTLFSENSKIRKFGEPYSAVELKSSLDQNQYLKPLLDTAPYAKTNVLAARAGNKSSIEAMQEAINKILYERKSIVEVLTAAKEKIATTR